MCRMNSASRGLRPTVGLRRPKNVPCVGGGRRLARKRLGRPISIGVKASGRWSAYVPNEFGLPGPSANGRPAPTEKRSLRRRRPTPGAERLGRPISNRRESLRRPKNVPCVGGGRRVARSALEGRFPIGVKACADREGVFCVGGGRRLARSALEGRFPIGVKACADRESVLCVGGGRRVARSALEGRFPIGVKACADRKTFLASAEADAWRGAPWKADFNRREGLRLAVGMHTE